MLKVALTGNIASGKSSVAEVWRGFGALVIEADELSRRAVARGTPALARIAARWGPGILLPTGELDRAALRDVVFRDPAERAVLEAIVHPEVSRLRGEEHRRAEAAGLPLTVSDIPLLFETGLETEFDVVVLVDAPEAIRLERLVADRGLDPDEARRMIDSQWSSDRKRSHADIVIDNEGSRRALEAEAARVWAILVARAGEGQWWFSTTYYRVDSPRAGGGGKMTSDLVRMDMHLHTHRSFDCLSRPEAILATAEARGIDRLVITDHNEIRGALELKRLDPERVIVGEEVKTREGFDVIGILIQELIPKGTPARRTCELIREQGGVVYLPHPFDGMRGPDRSTLDSLLDLVDVIEVHNARCWPGGANDLAAKWALETGKLAGAGSDAHTLHEIGRAYVEVPSFAPDRSAFLDALVRGRIGSRRLSSPVFRVASTWAKLRKRLPF